MDSAHGQTSHFVRVDAYPRPVGVPAYRWLYDTVKQQILDGRLTPGARLPGTRDIAAHYGLSRGTIVSAFEQLTQEGYLEGSVGSGTYVSKSLPQEPLNAERAGDSVETLAQRRNLSPYARQVKPFFHLDPRAPRSFRPHLPAMDLFPIGQWAQIAARRIRSYTVTQMVGCDAMGYGPLREAIANYLRTARGVRCEAHQVVIVSGTQEALDIISRLYLNANDRVAMEDPGYPGAARVFESHGAQVCPIPVDEDGMAFTPALLRGARLAYVTPAHQFPTGVAMSLSRRLDLLEWARTNHALVFEDDYDSEYRYSGRPIPALQGLDRHGVVIHAASFSKVLFPSLRLGYFVVPPDMVDQVAAAKGVTMRHAPLLEQLVLAEFIAEGHFARHIRRMRDVYSERLGILAENARSHLSGLLDLSTIEAGLQTIGWLRPGLAEADACAAAQARGIEVTPLGRYTRGPVRRNGLMLGFAAIDANEIRRGTIELAMALEGAQRRLAVA
ncbi:PLP-dependent aminotransferase family protein [Tahibacter amnicola]|uniref:PLP-dependent aminotransferase family protein n=1 Tax=Tahibacter amnicola TaxID=2976241 RepID=A0ABY6B966_9GAMM|nr:PLP-dependent aminotransferase family protein [Tahibacter amnicola]UXI66544.1 PLP-dependent aminotransferase family protein [Tahibacter amnicola]